VQRSRISVVLIAVKTQFLIESIVLSLTGGLVGIVLGVVSLFANT